MECYRQICCSGNYEHTKRLGIYDQSIQSMCDKLKVNAKQCTIIWHVDDLKISHVDKNVEEDIIKSLNKEI